MRQLLQRIDKSLFVTIVKSCQINRHITNLKSSRSCSSCNISEFGLTGFFMIGPIANNRTKPLLYQIGDIGWRYLRTGKYIIRQFL